MGGMGSTVYHLSSRLADMGHKISVITRKSRGEPPQLDNVEIIEVPWLKVPLEFTRSYGRSALKALIVSFRESSRCGPPPLPHGIME